MKKLGLLATILVVLLANMVNVSAFGLRDSVSGSISSQYKVIYKHTTGGKLVGETEEMVNYGEYPKNPPLPVALDGYQFTGWSINGEEVTETQQLKIYEDTEILAHFEKSSSFVIDATNFGPLVPNLSALDEVEVGDLQIDTDALQQQFTALTCTVTYVAGRDGLFPDDIEQSLEESVIRGFSPTNEPIILPYNGKIHTGWTDGVSFSKYVEDFVIQEDTELTATYANGTAYHVIYGAGNHGTLEGNTYEKVTDGESPRFAPLVVPAIGYEFIGWKHATTGVVYDDLSELAITDVTNLYAEYKSTSEMDSDTMPDNSNNGDVDTGEPAAEVETAMVYFESGSYGYIEDIFSLEVVIGERVETMPVVIANEGYQHIGWSGNATDGLLVEDLSTVIITGRSLFTAVYEELPQTNNQDSNDSSDSDNGSEQDSSDSNNGSEQDSSDSNNGSEQDSSDSDNGSEQDSSDSDNGSEQDGSNSDNGSEQNSSDSDNGSEQNSSDSDNGSEQNSSDTDNGSEQDNADSDNEVDQDAADKDNEDSQNQDDDSEGNGNDDNTGLITILIIVLVILALIIIALIFVLTSKKSNKE